MARTDRRTREFREGLFDEVEFLFEGPRTSAWRARKWRDEPSSTFDENYRRYDFRYYDRESLLHLLENEEWSEGDEPNP